MIIAQSLLNHVPAYDQAIAKIKSLLAPGGIVIVGVYNALGKFVQRCFAHDYRSDRLRLDQEHSPFEVTFDHDQVLRQWQPLCLRSVYPGWRNQFVTLHNLFNGRNGGLTLYVFEQQHD